MRAQTQPGKLAVNLKKTDRVGEIDIYGQIGKDWFGDGVDPKDFKRQLDSLGDLDRLNVRMHSYGGYVYEGWPIFNALNSHNAEVHIYVDGAAMSMASVILMAADVKHVAKNATVMIHDPMSIAIGNAGDMRKAAEELDRIRDQIVDTYIDGGVKASREEIETMMTEETYLSAQRAVELGFADVIGEEESEEAQASAVSAPAAIINHLSGSPANTMEPVNMTAPATPPASPENTAEVLAAARAAAAAEAHKRYSDIMALSKPGLESFVKALADDVTVTVADAKMKIANKYVEQAQNALNSSAQSRNPAVPSEPVAAAPEANTLQEKWDKNVGNVKNEFASFEDFQAFEQANSKGLIKTLGGKR